MSLELKNYPNMNEDHSEQSNFIEEREMAFNSLLNETLLPRESRITKKVTFLDNPRRATTMHRQKEVLLTESTDDEGGSRMNSILRKENIIRKFTVKEVREVMRCFKLGGDPDEEKKPIDKKKKKKKGQVGFSNNKINTAKYTIFNFLPLNLFHQLTKMANAYFLFFAILQCIPEISNTQGKPTMLLPLIFVISVSMLKDLLEDYKRQKSDKEENCRKVMASNPQKTEFTQVEWQSLKVGQFVKVV